jgi:hypothetical protein
MHKGRRTAATVLAQISRAFHFRDRHVFLRIYTQYVWPHLEFGTPTCSPWTTGDKECLERVQMRAVRMVSSLRGTSYKEKLKEIGFTTLKEHRHRLDVIQTYKIVSGKEKVESSTWFQMASESIRTTRQAADPLNLRPTSAKLEVRRNFFSQRVVQDWNKIPSDIKSAHSVESFKKGYAKHRERVV